MHAGAAPCRDRPGRPERIECYERARIAVRLAAGCAMSGHTVEPEGEGYSLPIRFAPPSNGDRGRFRVDRAVQNAGEEFGFLPAPVEAKHELVQGALKVLRADPVERSA